MPIRLKISHHKHSGRLRPHEHTSYFPLIMLLVIVGVLLSITSVAVSSADLPPTSNSIGLIGSVPGDPPTVGATIISPKPGQRFATSPITIDGTCQAGILVEVFKNDIFAGSSVCSDGGTFSFDIDLLIGQNELIAKVFDALNQPGPDSGRVVVFYDALPFQAGALTPLDLGAQMLLNTDAVFRGAFPDRELTIPVEIIGGLAPFAVNIQWGDSNNKVISRNDNQPFKTSHTYNRPGTYQVAIQATDAEGRTAFLTVASVVNGQLVSTVASGVSKDTANRIFVLWPVYTASVAVVVSFWLGERREKRILSRQPMNPFPQA